MHDIYTSSLEEDYDQRYNQAEAAKAEERYEDAARHLEAAATILEDIAEAEPNANIAEERRTLAESHRDSAEECWDLAQSADDSGPKDNTNDGPPTAGDDSTVNSQLSDPERTRQSDSDDEKVVDAEWLTPDPGIDFDDVGGMDHLKTELREKILEPLEYSELHERYDLGSVNGAILHGESGVGKSYIIKALAGELGDEWAHISVRPSDIMGSYVGEPAQNLREMLATARANAPAIVFIDEIDGLFPPRSTGRSSDNQRQLINEMLIQMIEIRDEDVVVVGATNMLDQLDDAVVGRHRFNKVIEVTRPDADAREDIFRVHLRDRPTAMENINFGVLRADTEGMTAADIEELVDEAARMALQDAKAAGQDVPITQEHLFDALEALADDRDSI